MKREDRLGLTQTCAAFDHLGHMSDTQTPTTFESPGCEPNSTTYWAYHPCNQKMRILWEIWPLHPDAEMGQTGIFSFKFNCIDIPYASLRLQALLKHRLEAVLFPFLKNGTIYDFGPEGECRPTTLFYVTFLQALTGRPIDCVMFQSTLRYIIAALQGAINDIADIQEVTYTLH